MSADRRRPARRARRARRRRRPGPARRGVVRSPAPGDRALPADAERPLRRAVSRRSTAGRQRPVPLDGRPRPPRSSPTTRPVVELACALLDEDRRRARRGPVVQQRARRDHARARGTRTSRTTASTGRSSRSGSRSTTSAMPARCASSPARTSGRRSPRSSSRHRRRHAEREPLPPPPDVDERVAGGGADVVAARRRRDRPRLPDAARHRTGRARRPVPPHLDPVGGAVRPATSTARTARAAFWDLIPHGRRDGDLLACAAFPLVERTVGS